MANKKKTGTIIGVIAALAGTYAILRTIGKKKVKEDEESFKNDPDAYTINEETKEDDTFYEAHSKRAIDVILSFFGLVLLSPLYLIITLAIKIDDPGPVLFTQKRVGKNKKFFKLHKFRSMKMDTPHDMPTHMLENPDQYITRVGKFLRKSSLDELPQIWDIFVGNMSIIGPRPALWNQKDLVEERDKYGANDVTPGLTGWAQINGRDELEIPVKAKLDGDYVKAVKSNSLKGLFMDIKCFFGTISSVAKSEGVVEGGTGEMHKALREDVPEEDPEEDFAYRKSYTVDHSAHKKVLITGAGSYIGESFKDYASKHYGDNLDIDTVDMISPKWRDTDFSQYDIVYHVAGLAHADVGHVSDEVKEKYYKVNTDLTIEVAKKAKAAGVKQFIFMSSMIVYGESAPFGKEKMVDENTIPTPANFYGDSKWQADKAVRALANDTFKVAVIRPPMIYGKGSKGNYPVLAKLAKKLPVFPNVNNKRSMLHIDNLCEFLCQLMLTSEGGIFMPQNSSYTKTAEMVKEIASVSGHKMAVTGLLNPFVALASHVPGKVSGLVNKAFGNMTYDMKMSHFPGMNYNINSLKTSIEKTETEKKTVKSNKVLILASVASMIDQFNMDNIKILKDLGCEVHVACNLDLPGNLTTEKVEELKKKLDELHVVWHQIDFTRSVFQLNKDKVAYDQTVALFKKENYAFVHCHSPIGGVIARLAGKKTNTKVIYTAHGFHFYKGAPLKNWLMFYPIEKSLSKYTDTLITITHEDYERAHKEFGMKHLYYVPGIGIDLNKFKMAEINPHKRHELGLKDDDIMLLSVGELNVNKNHEVVIRAIAQINDPKVHYFIAGIGDLKDYLADLVKELNVEKQVHFLGFRTDINELDNACDIFLLPSKREGLNVSLMEAMACGKPCIANNIRGNNDLIDDQKGGYLLKNDIQDYTNAIQLLAYNQDLQQKFGDYNLNKINKFSDEKVQKEMFNIYQDCLNNFKRSLL